MRGLFTDGGLRRSGGRTAGIPVASAIPLIDENIELNRDLWETSAGVDVRSGVLDWDEEVPDWVWTSSREEGEEEEVGLDVIL
jgi:hypothetical protein